MVKNKNKKSNRLLRERGKERSQIEGKKKRRIRDGGGVRERKKKKNFELFLEREKVMKFFRKREYDAYARRERRIP